MRVLLEQECAAVAGGHDPDCEQQLKTALIVGGVVVGGAAGGPGGAIIGGTAGALFSEAFGHSICEMSKEEREERAEAERLEQEMDALYEQQYVNWRQGSAVGNSPGSSATGPHQLVVDTGSY